MLWRSQASCACVGDAGSAAFRQGVFRIGRAIPTPIDSLYQNPIGCAGSDRRKKTRLGCRLECPEAKLRPGNVSSAEEWDELLLPEIERQQAEGKSVRFRGAGLDPLSCPRLSVHELTSSASQAKPRPQRDRLRRPASGTQTTSTSVVGGATESTPTG